MTSGSAPQESKPQVEHQPSRSKHEVTRRLTAYSVQAEGQATDTRIIEEGTIVWADPDFRKDRPQESALIVRFLFDDCWFYVDRETFAHSTHKV
jgi:hypothetical protein